MLAIREHKYLTVHVHSRDDRRSGDHHNGGHRDAYRRLQDV